MLYYAEDYNYDYSLELTEDIIVDFDSEGYPRAFEFLNASKLFKLDKFNLMHIKKINVTIKVTSKLIELNILLVANLNNKDMRSSLEKSLVNNVNLPELDLYFV